MFAKSLFFILIIELSLNNLILVLIFILDGWIVCQEDRFRQVNCHLPPWLDFDLLGTTYTSGGSQTLSFRDVEPQNKLTGVHFVNTLIPQLKTVKLYHIAKIDGFI